MKSDGKRLKKRLIVSDIGLPAALQGDDEPNILSWLQFRRALISTRLFRLFRKYDHVILVEPHLWLRPRPMLVTAVLRLSSKGECTLMDRCGNTVSLTYRLVLHKFFRLLVETCLLPFVLRQVKKELHVLGDLAGKQDKKALVDSGSVVYLKTDMWFSTQVGGSVTHMAGVVNAISEGGCYRPQIFATAPNPLLGQQCPAHEILPDSSYWDFRDVPAMRFSRTACRDVLTILGDERPAFIYQRYSLNNYAGVLLARQLSVPLVTEYNGSEVWIGRNWGRSVAYPAISEKIERLNLDAADLIVVVSAVSRDELAGRGVDTSRILVNPNGVSAEVFHPHIEVTEMHRTMRLSERRIIGFIGTFGPWHGTEELVRAFACVLERYAGARGGLQLLMVGDGAWRAAAERLAADLNIGPYVTFTGQVSQLDAPRYLACCDILVAPHVPNPDGTPFFGSPTKLFEYMAMGRPIVASRLGQMEELLDHGQTAWLVEPGEPESLANGLMHLLSDDACCFRLGEAARREVLSKYTWQIHVGKILAALRERCQ